MIFQMIGLFAGFSLSAAAIGLTDKWFALPMSITGAAFIYFSIYGI